ncbi:hypothetical protein JCM25156A_17310 [Komagataeibacter kakiaceti JCM 25156]
MPQPFKIRTSGSKLLHECFHQMRVTTDAGSPEFGKNPSGTAFPFVQQGSGCRVEKDVAQQVALLTVQPSDEETPGRFVGDAGIPQGIQHITGHGHLLRESPDGFGKTGCGDWP